MGFCYTSKPKLSLTLNGFTHGLGSYGVEAQWLLGFLGFVVYK